MARYYIINRSSANLQIVIPAPPKSGRYSAVFTLPTSQGIDVLPYAGSIENCKRIAQLRDFSFRGLIEILED